MNKNTPTAITADRNQRVLLVKWEDGHQSEIAFALLREACPCAQCRGGHENMRTDPDPDLFLIPLMNAQENQLIDIQPVGNYAVTLVWGDGHKYGIYQWDYIRALCTCDICSGERS